MNTRDVMTTRVVAVGAGKPTNKIAELLLENGIGAIPVLNGTGTPIVARVAFASSPSSARALQHDLDAAVLRAAVRRVVRGDRMRVAEPLGRDDVGVDALRGEVRHDIVGSA